MRVCGVVRAQEQEIRLNEAARQGTLDIDIKELGLCLCCRRVIGHNEFLYVVSKSAPTISNQAQKIAHFAKLNSARDDINTSKACSFLTSQ